MPSQVVAIWLDGFEISLADEFGLPVLADLVRTGAVARLDHGTAHLTGLTGEHLATGLDPEGARRFSAVEFDPLTYRCSQVGTKLTPVFSGLSTVVLDPCYFDLSRTGEEVVGVTDWGAHDPGGVAQSRPDDLRDEIERRFGAYPARRWMYATPWASASDCLEMGRALEGAVKTRSRIATWLLGERFQDWDVAFIGVSESHTASEGLFHGIGPNHPWHDVDSASAARTALRAVYRAIDDLVGEIIASVPDATVVVFTMHGMGVNTSDVPSMALLGELMARWSGITTNQGTRFPLNASGVPLLEPGVSWTSAVLEACGDRRPREVLDVARALKRRLPPFMQRAISRARSRRRPQQMDHELSLDWMPLMRHHCRWPEMKAFAVPSFYDGRIRLNLAGRESSGVVPESEFESVVSSLERLLDECTEIRTGRPAVASVRRREGDPLARANDDVDLIVHWESDVLGLAHPALGEIGPFPPRRTGGHSSPIGRCIVVGPGIRPGDLGVRSSFDVLPTVLSLAGDTAGRHVSGRPILTTT